MWPEKHGDSWRIRDRIGGRITTLQSGYASKTAAKAAIAQATADRLRGDALVPRGGQVLLDEWIDAWLPLYEMGLKPTSAHSEPARVRNHIRPLLGSYTLEEIDPLAIKRWLAQLAAGGGDLPGGRPRRPLAPKTMRNVHALLHKILSEAVTAKLIRANPCWATARSIPKRQRKEMRFLTDPEIARLITAVPAHWRPLVLLLIATGLRWGEAIGLQIKHVDLLAKTPQLTVLQHLHELASTGELVVTGPKSEMSRRTVTFTLKVALALTPLWSGRDRDEFMFLAPRGGKVRTRNFRRGWVKWTAAAALAGLRIHDLRHTHAGILISDGRSLTAVQRRLGHSSIAVTSDLYGHLRPEVDEGILAAIGAALDGIDLDALDAEVAAELAEV